MNWQRVVNISVLPYDIIPEAASEDDFETSSGFIQGCPPNIEMMAALTPDLEVNLLLNLTVNDPEINDNILRTMIEATSNITRSTPSLEEVSGLVEVVNSTLNRDKQNFFLSLRISSANLGTDVKSVLINVTIMFTAFNGAISEDCVFLINVIVTEITTPSNPMLIIIISTLASLFVAGLISAVIIITIVM